MAGGLFANLRRFDAYPKTLEDFRIKTFSGAFGTGTRKNEREREREREREGRWDEEEGKKTSEKMTKHMRFVEREDKSIQREGGGDKKGNEMERLVFLLLFRYSFFLFFFVILSFFSSSLNYH